MWNKQPYWEALTLISSPCLSGERTLCCNEVMTTFDRQKEHLMLNCKKEYIIFLMKCILLKIQYVRKAETSFNLRLNNHSKDSKEVNSILGCNHNFKDIISTKHVKLIMIDNLIILNGSKEPLRVVRKSFLVQKLKVLVPFGLNLELCK